MGTDARANGSFQFHPIASIFPLLEGEELLALADDIAMYGQREPIILFEGKILDGRNRYSACKARGITPTTREFEGDYLAAIDFAWSENFHRRDMDSSQRAAAVIKKQQQCEEYARQVEEIKEAAKSRKGGDRKSESVRERIPARNDDNRTDSVLAKQAGTNRKYIADAREIFGKSPELGEQVAQGKLTIPKAKRAIANQEKRRQLKEKAESVLVSEQPPWLLIHSDVLSGLQSVWDHHSPARLIFADPPYNIGVDYGDGEKADKLPDSQYMLWVGEWIDLCCSCLASDGSLWILIGDEYAAEYCIALKAVGLHLRSWVKWYETFGVNCSNKFNRTSRHLFYCVRDPKQFVFNADAVTRPSDRQLKYNDKRASEGGKIWDDVWTIPRLTGTCEERIPDFPTQLPLALVEPIVLCASDPGDLVIDPFNGSGTTGVACIRNQRKYIGIDKSEQFIDAAETRLKAALYEVQ